MTADREVRLLLERARCLDPDPPSGGENEAKEPPRVRAREIFERVMIICDQTAVPSSAAVLEFNVPELLVQTAETAIIQMDFDTANASISRFFCESRVKNQVREPACDTEVFIQRISNPLTTCLQQFYCRALLARAQCESHGAQQDVGPTKLRKILNALHFVVQVIPIATDPKKRPMYDFLVYNASVVYWQVARQMMKESTFQFLTPSMSTVVEALKLVKEQDELWVVRLLMALAHAFIDGKQFGSAAKIINEAVDERLSPMLGSSSWKSNSELKRIYDEALCLQVHIGSLKDAECQKIISNVKKSVQASPDTKRLSLLVKLQCLKSGNLTGTLDEMYTDIFRESTGMSTFTSATSKDDVRSFLTSLNAAALSTIDAEVVVEIGLHVAMTSSVELAARCDDVLERKGKNMQPRTRLLHQVLKAVLLAVSNPAHGGDQSSHQREQLVLSRRVDSLKSLERTLLAIKRLDEPNILEQACMIAWRLSLPLLQPHLRTQVERLFNLASTLLDESESLLLAFRSHLYLEIAKLDAALDFVAKAYANSSKGIGLDYGTIKASVGTPVTIAELCAHAAEWMHWPVNLSLQWISQTARLKLDPDNKQGAEDVVVAALERIRTVNDARQQHSLVLRCNTDLIKLEESLLPSLDVVHLLLWSRLGAMTWQTLHDMALTRRIVAHTIDTWFSEPKRDMTLLHANEYSDEGIMAHEIELRLLMVEVIGEEMNKLHQGTEFAAQMKKDNGQKSARQRLHGEGALKATEPSISSQREVFIFGVLHPIDTSQLDTVDTDSESASAHAADIAKASMKLKLELLSNLSAAIALGARLGWTFLLENACIYLWNYHFQLLLMLLETAGDTAPECLRPQMIMPECIAAFEAAYAALESAGANIDCSLLSCFGLGLCTVYEKSSRWDKAVAIADALLKRSTPVASPTARDSIEGISVSRLKQFAENKARAQIAQSSKDIVFPDSWTVPLRVVGLLETMESMLRPSESGATLPIEKARTYFDKAVALWHPTAAVMLGQLLDQQSVRSLEHAQQQAELLAEVWVRIGYGALHLKFTKFAIECAEEALRLVNEKEGDTDGAAWQQLIAPEMRTWLASAELLYGMSIVNLASGQKISRKLLYAASNHFVLAAEHAHSCGRSKLMLKAVECLWNSLVASDLFCSQAHAEAVESLASNQLTRLVTDLVKILKILQQLGSTDHLGAFYGDMILLTLDLCERNDEWQLAFQVCSDIISNQRSHSSSFNLSVAVTEQIHTVHAIAASNIGKDTLSNLGAGSRQSDGSDPLLQAQILKQIALASSSNGPTQLRMLTNAHSGLADYKDEQALVLVDMAECLFTNCFPVSDTLSCLDSAAAILLHCAQLNAERSTVSQSRSRGSTGQVMSTPTPVGKRSELPTRSALWFSEKLIRVFVMRAAIACDFSERAKFVHLALEQVYEAWEIIIQMGNEAELYKMYLQSNGADGASDFDTWRATAPQRYLYPRTTSEWLTFFAQYEKSTEARFYMVWAEVLNAVISSGNCVVTDPILTAHYLSQLLEMLRHEWQYELMVPVLCLYQVLHAATVHHLSEATAILTELMIYTTMERLRAPQNVIPLQRACAIISSQRVKLIEELTEAALKPSQQLTGGPSTKRARLLLQSASTNALVDAIAAVQLLIDTGFVRQAKSLLDMVTTAISTKTTALGIVASQCDILASRILDIEGKSLVARAKVQHALTFEPRLHLANYLKWTLWESRLTIDTKEKLCILDNSCKIAAAAIIRYKDVELQQASAASATHQLEEAARELTGQHFSLDILVLLAQVKLKMATILLKQAAGNSVFPIVNSNRKSALQQSQKSFSEARGILSSIRADGLCGRMSLQYLSLAGSLLEHDSTLGNIFNGIEMREQLRTAIEQMESAGECMQRHWTPPMSPELLPSSCWEIYIVRAKLQAVMHELWLESGGKIVAAHDMTWYEYEQNSKRNIVERWLTKTNAWKPTLEGGDLPYAVSLLASAGATGNRATSEEELRAMTQLLRAQCERLSLCHHNDKAVATTVHSLLWTRYPSTAGNGDDATWICARSSKRESVTPAVDGSTNEREIEAFLDDTSGLVQNCQQVGLDRCSISLVRRSASELIQLFGCRRPLECAKSLLLYQSCVVGDIMAALLRNCLPRSTVQSLHLRRLKRLKQFHADAASNSLPFQLSQLYMDQQSDAFKRMGTATSVDVAIASIPPNYRLLCLQFSPDKCFLFATLLNVSEKHCTMARMEVTDTFASNLNHITQRLMAWRASSGKVLLSFEDKYANDEYFDYVGVNAPDSLASERDVLESEFSDIIADTANLLEPLLSHAAMQAQLKSDIAGNPLLLLLDRELAALPLEALPALESADSVTRDFSIHMLHHRLSAVKAQPLRRDEVRTIVDPHQEDNGGTDGQNMRAVVTEICTSTGSTLLWKEAVEHNQIPTVVDWQHALASRRGGSTFYLGPSRIIGSSLPLGQLAGMNIAQTCHALLLLDHAENAASVRRQSKCDNEKLAWELDVERDPYLRAMLLSLVGVNVLVINQWTTTFSGNRRLATGLLQGLAKGQSIGRALKAFGDATVSVACTDVAATLTPSGSGGLPLGSTAPIQTSSTSALSPADATTSSTGGSRSVPGGGTIKMKLKNRLRYNTIAYGLAHLGLKSGE